MSKINYKTLSKFPTIKLKYDDLQRKVTGIIVKSGNSPRLTFSIFESVEDGKVFHSHLWTVIAPDIESKKPVFKGKCIFSNKTRWGGYTSQVINNPTWKDIIIFANFACGDDHIFLESVELKEKVKGIKYFTMDFGS